MGREQKLGTVEIFFCIRSLNQISVLAIRHKDNVIRFGNTPAADNPTGNPHCATTPSLPSNTQVALACQAPLTGQYLVIRQPENLEIDEIFAYPYESNIVN